MQRSAFILCAFIFSNTFGVGAFPVLLPEIGGDGLVGDIALGAIAGAYGLARLAADIPAGLFITHHLRHALVAAAVSIAAGVLLLSAGGPVWSLILGRLIWGVGHALAMVSGITAIVRDTQPRGHAVSLNAFEMSGMCGVLFGMVAAGLLPREWPWNVSLAVASSPVLLGIALLPSLLRAVPADHRAASARPLFAQADKATGAASAAPQAQTPHLAVLAVAAGATIAFAWSAVGQFLLPLRASREFGLDRVGVASLVAVPQFVDVAVLLPLGALADRTSRARALGWMLILFAGGVAAVAFGNLPVAILGCVLFGVGLAGWMLPVSLLNQGAEPGSIAWRTALYRLAVDAGIFLGPLLGGFLLSRSLLGIGSAVVVALLTILGLRFLLRSHSAHRSPDQTRMTAP